MPSGRRREQYVTSLKIYFGPRLTAVASRILKSLLWDVIKMQIRATSIQYAKQKKSSLKQKEYFLEKEVLALEIKLEENNLSEPRKEILHAELRIKKQQLEKIIGYKTQVVIIRSKVKWYNEGERNTKYFHSLEKRHFNIVKLSETLLLTMVQGSLRT